MKSKFVLLFVLFAVIISLGAARITKTQVAKETDTHNAVPPHSEPIGGLAMEDR